MLGKTRTIGHTTPGNRSRRPKFVAVWNDRVKTYRFNDQLKTIFAAAAQLSAAVDADALLMLLDGPTDWERLKSLAGEEKIVIELPPRLNPLREVLEQCR